MKNSEEKVAAQEKLDAVIKELGFNTVFCVLSNVIEEDGKIKTNVCTNINGIGMDIVQTLAALLVENPKYIPILKYAIDLAIENMGPEKLLSLISEK